MIDSLLASIAPHPCYKCGKIGGLLCSDCKYNIITERDAHCIACETPARDGICSSCLVPYQKAWCVGERLGELRSLIDGYKFESKREASKIVAELLAGVIDVLPDTTQIVPIPTVSSHIRERGFDHTLLLAKEFARIRKLELSTLLMRATNTTQKGVSRSMRMHQAKNAFSVKGKLNKNVPYLLIDDVITTGATLQYATQALMNAGARDVWVAVVARQPLD